MFLPTATWPSCGSCPLIIIGTFLARGLFAFGSTYLTEYVGNRIVADLRNQLNARIQLLSLRFFDRQPTGTILSRVSSDVSVVGAALTGTVASLLRDSVSLVVLIVVAFLQDWVLSLIAFVVFPAAVLPMIWLSQAGTGVCAKAAGIPGRVNGVAARNGAGQPGGQGVRNGGVREPAL